MPRIRQLAEQYAEKDFWTEINGCCGYCGIRTDTALGKAIGVEAQTVRKYKKNPGMMQVKTMQKIVEQLKPNILALLKFLGYSDMEIMRFAQLYISQKTQGAKAASGFLGLSPAEGRCKSSLP